MKSYLFYDIETTGLNKSFDQILQFAAIRTDEKLNEKERYSIQVKLRPDVVPSPHAAITHRIPLADMDQGLTELDAVSKIHTLLNAPGTISLGYNTLGFDDEFLRFSFHRNLLPPYHHQYAGGCGRMDLLPMAVLYFLYKPEVISWPDIDGKSTLKLEHLSRLNSLAEGKAHDAMVDVEATLELARRFIREKGMWDFILGYFNKDSDRERVGKLPSAFDSSAGMHLMGIMTGSRFGSDALYQAPVLYLGDSIPYKNQSLWLRLDDPELREVKDSNVLEKTSVLRKRMGEPNMILPPHDRFMGRLDSGRKALMEENLAWLKRETKLFYAIIKENCEFRYPEVPDVDPDASLYVNGFLSREQEKLCVSFHRNVKKQGAELIAGFSEGPLRQLALRVLFRNFGRESFAGYEDDYIRYRKKVSPADEMDAMKDYRNDRKLTPKKALEQIEELRKGQEMDPEQTAILHDLEGYIIKQFLS